MHATLTLAGVLLGTFGPATGPDLRVSEDITVGGVPFVKVQGRANTFLLSDQNGASLAVRQDGSFALAWASRRQNNGMPGVFVRTFDSFGRPMSAEVPASTDRRTSQLNPTVVWAGDKPLALYATQFRDGQQSSVFAGDTQINASGIGSKDSVTAASMPNGTTFAVWLEETRQNTPRVFVRVLDADGTPVGEPTLLSTAPGGRDIFPTVTADQNGAVVAWLRFDSNGKAEGVYAQRLDATGQPVGSRRLVAEGQHLSPSLSTAGGNTVLASLTIGTGETCSVETRVLDSALNPVGQPSSTALQSGYIDAVTVDGREDGAFAVAWSQVSDDQGVVRARMFESDGSPAGEAFDVSPSGPGTRTISSPAGSSRVAYTDAGLTVAWSGDGGIADKSGAYFTRIVPATALTGAVRTELNEVARETTEFAANAKAVAEKPRMEFVRVVQEGPTPHTPPIDRPWLATNEWQSSIPMSAGGFNAWTPTTFTPPDPDVAIGPDDIITVVNDGIAFHKKDGTTTFRTNMRFTNGFWGSFSAVDNFIYDPEAFFDYSTGRWWVMATQGAGSGTKSWALIAVSATSDPNGAWNKYQFDVSSLAGNFFDSPNFGVDGNVLYVTGDGFGLGSNYPVFTFDKASLLAGNPPAIQRSLTLPTSTQSAGIPDTVDRNEPAYYMVEHQEGANRTQISLVALRDPLGTPNFTRFQITVPAYSNPENIPSGGTGTRVTAFDSRFWSVKYRNGSIWATHHVSNPIRARWYEIRPNGWPVSGNNPVLVQSGDIDLGSGIRSSFSSVGVDPAGNATVAYARSSTTEFFSSAYSTRKLTDPLGTMPTSAIAQVSNGPYTTTRWGDYSGVEADPAYPSLFWSHHEWAETNNWRTWVQPYRATTEVVGTAIRTFRGAVVSGGLQETLIDDGTVFQVRNGVTVNRTEPPVSVILSSRSWVRVPTQMSFTVDARVSTGGLFQRIELFDWVANQWVQIDQRAATLAFNRITVPVTNPARFVKAGLGEIEARVSFGSSGPVGANTWTADYDLLSWDIQ